MKDIENNVEAFRYYFGTRNLVNFNIPEVIA